MTSSIISNRKIFIKKKEEIDLNQNIFINAFDVVAIVLLKYKYDKWFKKKTISKKIIDSSNWNIENILQAFTFIVLVIIFSSKQFVDKQSI
jgi:hypothetical protein